MQFSSVQLVPFCLVSFSCSFQFANKWIHSFIKQFGQGEAAAKIYSFTYDRQLTKLVIATPGHELQLAREIFKAPEISLSTKRLHTPDLNQAQSSHVICKLTVKSFMLIKQFILENKFYACFW